MTLKTNIKLPITAVILSITAAFVPPQVSVVLLTFSVFGWLLYLNYLSTNIEIQLQDIAKKQGVLDEQYKKQVAEVKTLFTNQRMILSLVNAVRVRINNFYAKKLKEPHIKSVGFNDSRLDQTENGI